MPTIKYYIGEEKDVVIERKDYKESIFHEQYKQALMLTNRILRYASDSVPNLIAFCGDRGDGKTSCMMTVRYLLENINIDDGATNYINECINTGNDDNFLTLKRFHSLPIVDPMFFDENHNVVELLVGQMYKEFREETKKRENCDIMVRNGLVKQFQTVKDNLKFIDDNKIETYDPLEELEQLSAGINLAHSIRGLIKKYLAYMGKDIMIVSIDDVDLNISQAYEMCEHIRKYLGCENCLVFLSVKIDQLLSAIEVNIKRNYWQIGNEADCKTMAARYVDKLIPDGERISMPKVYDLAARNLEVYNDRQHEEACYTNTSVKEGVCEMIFRKTRYLFYNSKGSISMIVPNNLRSLMHLLGMIFSMRNVTDDDNGILDENKQIFKSYFFQTWTKQLDSKYQTAAATIVNGDDETNKFVVNFLGQKIRSPHVEEDEEALRSVIISDKNYNYNVSVGDVLNIITYLQRSTYDKDLLRFLFFVKSYYSMSLYEKYDLITENGMDICPNEADTEQHIYKSDALFNKTTPLQRLVAGRFFSYVPNYFLPSKGSNSSDSRDFRVLNGRALYRLITQTSNIINEINGLRQNPITEESTQRINTLFMRLRMAEYFALTIMTSIPEKQKDRYASYGRSESLPYYLRPFFSSTGYYLFDFTAIFVNIINYIYAYNRWNNRDLHSELIECKDSLLFAMADSVFNARYNEHIDILDIENRHNLLSDATIRNFEILEAMQESLRSKRFDSTGTKNTATILADKYKELQRIGIKTYKLSDDEDPYQIVFAYLDPVIEMLSDESINQPCQIGDGEEPIPTFNDIFSYEVVDGIEHPVTNGEELCQKIKMTRSCTGRTILKKLRSVNEIILSNIDVNELKQELNRERIYTVQEFKDIAGRHFQL